MTGFIELTSLYDERKMVIRVDCIECVSDNAEDHHKPECRTVWVNGRNVDVIEGYEDILGLIRQAELLG